MKAIDRKLLFHLVDVVWGEAHEDQSVPSTEWASRMIVKAIERRRSEKYAETKVCPECGKECKNSHGLSIHRRRVHDKYWLEEFELDD